MIERVTFDDGTEATINRQVAEDLFENDILLTLPQAQHILTEVKECKCQKILFGYYFN